MDLFDASSTMEERLYERAAMLQIPLYGILELTPQCNLSCEMCYVRLSNEEMAQKGRLRTLEEWIDLAEQMQQEGTLFVLLTGGEPLIYPKFRELYLKLQEMGMILTVNTNGSLIDRDWAEFFQLHPPRRINITLYGASSDTYEQLCHNGTACAKAFEAVRMLHETGLDVKINASLVRTNVQDWEKIMAFGESLEIPVRMDTYMYPAVREREYSFAKQSRMDPEMAAKVRIQVLRREMGEETFAQYREQTLASIVPDGQTGNFSDTLTCKAGHCSFAVSWNGKLLPCIVMDQSGISMKNRTFRDAWEQLQSEVNQIRISSECVSCAYREACNTCAAAAVAECGKYDAVPEYICAYTKETVRLLRE